MGVHSAAYLLFGCVLGHPAEPPSGKPSYPVLILTVVDGQASCQMHIAKNSLHNSGPQINVCDSSPSLVILGFYMGFILSRPLWGLCWHDYTSLGKFWLSSGQVKYVLRPAGCTSGHWPCWHFRGFSYIICQKGRLAGGPGVRRVEMLDFGRKPAISDSLLPPFVCIGVLIMEARWRISPHSDTYQVALLDPGKVPGWALKAQV